MRWSVFFLLSGFLAFSLYIGWEQGAFAFKKEQMALQQATQVQKKDTSEQQAIEQLLREMKEPLKLQLQAPIKERKLDEAVAMLEEELGKQKLSVAYGAVLQLAEQQEKKDSR
jgi:hypothetical protein